MKHLFIVIALALPLSSMAEEVSDTTVNYNGKQFVISEDSVETHVSVFSNDGTALKKNKETTFVGEQEQERFYISSPLFGSSSRVFFPTTPKFYCSAIGLTGSALGFSGADGVPYKIWGSFLIGINVVNCGLFLNKQKTWGVTMSADALINNIAFSNGKVLCKDDNENISWQNIEGAKSSHLFYVSERFDLMLKWYKYFKHPDADRLSIGLGIDYELVSWFNSISSYKTGHDDYHDAAGALKLNNTRLGLKAQVSNNGFVFFVEKSLTPLFKSNYAPKCYPFYFGLGLAF